MLAIVATAGAANANSYVTFSEAQAYLEARLHAEAWDTSEQKQMQALIGATQELDPMAWLGYRATSAQALSWPRTGVVNPDAPSWTEYGSSEIPARVKRMTYELALEMLRASDDVTVPDPNQNVIRFREKTDVIEEETEYAEPTQKAQGLARYPRILTLGAPLMEAGSFSGQARLVR